jgi:uncharacterized protein (TIGR03437 family)
MLLLAAGLPAMAQTLQITPATVPAFSAQAGSTTPMTQTISVNMVAPGGVQLGAGFNAFITNTSGYNWLSFAGQQSVTGTTPAQLTLTANPTGVPAASYTAKVTVFSGNQQAEAAVTLNIGQLSANPSSVPFSYVAGGQVPGTQLITISSPAPISFTAAASTTTGGNWLQVSPATGSTSAATAGATPSATIGATLATGVVTALPQGTYNGTITVTPTSALTVPLQIPVTLTVSPVPTITATPAALSYSYQIGAAGPVTQKNVTISTTGSSVVFSAASNAPSWLFVSPTGGVVSSGTPVTLQISVQPSGLAPANYSGVIAITGQGAAAVNIPVNLTVSASPLLTLDPVTLDFSYQVGTAAPAAKSIATSSTSTAIPYTVTTSTPWINVLTPGGSSPTPISISVNPANLTPGSYTGKVTVTAVGAGNPTQDVTVTLKVANDALVTANGSTSPVTVPFLYQLGMVPPVAQNIAIGSSTGALLSYTAAAATTSSGNWLNLSATSGTTPGNVVASVVTQNIAAGNYDGTITVTATNPATAQAAPNSPLTVPVKYYVSNSALLSVSPLSVTLNVANGAVAPTTLNITSTGEQLNYAVSFSTTSGGNWLAVDRSFGSTPSAVTVLAAFVHSTPGTYQGTVTITATNPNGSPVANSPVNIPVTMVVAAGTLQVSPASLNFTMPTGGTAANQTLTVSSAGTPLNFTAAATTSTGGNWLTVSTSGTQATVSVNGAGLPQGTYQGQITITAPGASNSPQVVPVTLTVGPAQTVVLDKSALTFNYQMGSQAPAAQSVAVTSTGGSLNFTTTVTVSSGASGWLLATPTATATPSSIAVSVNPANLQPGTYTGQISVASASATNSPQTVNVTLNVAALPTPVVTSVTNSASYAPGLIAPGEIVVLFGNNFGPSALTTIKVTNGKVDTTLADTQVLFDGIPAPLVYVSATQISAIVPYELAGRATTKMTVSYKGTASAPIEIRLADTAPGIFTLNQSGTGPGAVLNQNSTVNSPANPADKGSVVQIFATGEGQTNPRGVTGSVIPADNPALWTKPIGNVTVTIGGRPAQVVYQGSAPGAIAGLFQVNAVVPADAPSGPSVPVVVTVGSANSQAGVTIAVK